MSIRSINPTESKNIHSSNVAQLQPKSAKHDEISRLFGIPVEQINEVSNDNLLQRCIDEARHLLESGECVTTEKIKGITNLFFVSLAVNPEEFKEPIDPINPDPRYVFFSLRKCIDKIDSYGNFSEAVIGSRGYIESDQQLKGIIDDPNTSIKAINIFCEEKKNDPRYSGSIPPLRDKINKCPLYTARDWFGGRNIHEAYILRNNESLSCQWVFKPTSEKYSDEFIVLHGEDPDDTNRECTAYALNHHKEFPIPATYFVEINGYRGSIQLFIDDTLDITNDNRNQISVIGLQKLLIFDLLFSNLDRHDANYLFQQGKGSIIPFGIDHDSCMKLNGRALRIEYLEFEHAFDQHIMVELARLISEENLNMYEQIMRTRGINEKAINWMRRAAKTLNKQIENVQSTAMEVFKDLSAKFEQEHVL